MSRDADSLAAREAAETDHRTATDRWTEINEVVNALRDQRRANHFSELLAETFIRNRRD